MYKKLNFRALAEELFVRGSNQYNMSLIKIPLKRDHRSGNEKGVAGIKFNICLIFLCNPFDVEVLKIKTTDVNIIIRSRKFLNLNLNFEVC